MAVEKEILFVCVENAGRSQMAQAFAERYGLKSSSAGTVPSSRVNPVVVEGNRYFEEYSEEAYTRDDQPR